MQKGNLDQGKIYIKCNDIQEKNLSKKEEKYVFIHFVFEV